MLFRALLCALCLFSACGKKTAPAAPNTNPASAASEADLTATLQRLTQTVRRFSAEHRRVPVSLDELVTAGYLPELPPAPSGKKFGIDANLQVNLLDAK